MVACAVLFAACGSSPSNLASEQGDEPSTTLSPATTEVAATDVTTTDVSTTSIRGTTAPTTTAPTTTAPATAVPAPAVPNNDETAPPPSTSTASTLDVSPPSSALVPAAPTTAVTSSSASPTPSTPATETTTTETNTPAVSSTQATPTAQFGAEIFTVSGPIAARLEHSWREGCPVPLSDLRLITLNHWDFQGNVASGELIVHHDHADDMVQVFSRLFDAEFPIERMELVDNFLGDDDLSMAANNTSAFNCREIASRPGTWSTHAFGAAVDINPVQNPYATLSGDVVLPPEGAPFVDRSVRVVGGIYSGDAVTSAFADVGWGWGGDWNSVKDWQHFSATGG